MIGPRGLLQTTADLERLVVVLARLVELTLVIEHDGDVVVASSADLLMLTAPYHHV